MRRVIKECWQKRNRGRGTITRISREEYEEKVLPLLEEKVKNINAPENREALANAIDFITTARELFLASPEDLEKIKASILAEYRSNCLEDIEYETGYSYCCWSGFVKQGLTNNP